MRIMPLDYIASHGAASILETTTGRKSPGENAIL
jgi:hypothetical protein